MRRLFVAFLACSLNFAAISTTACTSMQPAGMVRRAATQPPTWNIQPGERIRVATKDGKQTTFIVAAIEPDFIVARGGSRYAFADITRVDARGFSGRRTLLLVGAVWVTLAAMAAAGGGGLAVGGGVQ
jgi:hypothetical protein